MIIKIKHKITFAQADQLIERYYDGLTTGAEEQQLRTFLSRKGLPERYYPEQAIFGYFEDKKKKRHFSIQPYIRWTSVAMLVLTVALSLQKFTNNNQTDYAYVNGKMITNAQQVRLLAKATLQDISTDADAHHLKQDSKELIEQQLSVFAE